MTSTAFCGSASGSGFIFRDSDLTFRVSYFVVRALGLQEYLAHKKHPPPRTLHEDYT